VKDNEDVEPVPPHEELAVNVTGVGAGAGAPVAGPEIEKVLADPPRTAVRSPPIPADGPGSIDTLRCVDSPTARLPRQVSVSDGKFVVPIEHDDRPEGAL
jgi:hypothetical protein